MENETYCLFCLDEIKTYTPQEKIDFGCICKVNFHNECMKVWLSYNTIASCPLCRYNMVEDNTTIIISHSQTNNILQNNTQFVLPFILVICMYLFVVLLIVFSNFYSS